MCADRASALLPHEAAPEDRTQELRPKCLERCLALRLYGPLQSWGTSSRFNRRNTDSMPSRSAVAGLLCAAQGLERGSPEEAAFLKAFASVRMTSVAVQKTVESGRDLADAFWDAVSEDDAPSLPQTPCRRMRRIQDFHTVLDTVSAGGVPKANPVLTYRQYLVDAGFYVFLCGEGPLLHRAAEALADPVWGLWLGRKSCIPSAPVAAGLFASMDEARCALLSGLCVTAEEEECTAFGEGTDSVPDVPLDFRSSGRTFGLRRVRRTV